MPIRNPHSRTISLRLSEEEYVGLKRVCVVTGARSVSDLIRDAMRALLNGVNRDDVLGFRIDEFCAQLKNLDRKIDRLARGVTGGKTDQ